MGQTLQNSQMHSGKGFRFCFECDVYPDCERFHEIADSCLKKGEDLAANLEKIKAGNIEEWLREEEKEWKCTSYGKPVSMHLREYYRCRAKLE